MRLLTIIAVLLLPVAAWAQQPAQYTITLSADHLNVVGSGLGKLPYEQAHQVVDEIMSQVIAQNQKAIDDQKKAFDEAVSKAAADKAKQEPK